MHWEERNKVVVLVCLGAHSPHTTCIAVWTMVCCYRPRGLYPIPPPPIACAGVCTGTTPCAGEASAAGHFTFHWGTDTGAVQ